jgi:hypothetical protein
MDDIRIDVTDATHYNQSQAGRGWRCQQLPFPFSAYQPQDNTFAHLVGLFQTERELTVDGKLGPNTVEAMKPFPAGEQPRESVSGNMVIDGDKKSAADAEKCPDIEIRNYRDDGVTEFDVPKERPKPPKHIVIHESVTPSASATVSTLHKKDLGVHLMVEPAGDVTCHNDLTEDMLWHAEELNQSSIGLEIINPYRADWIQAPFESTIEPAWWTWIPDDATKEGYVVPTPEQMDTLEWLVPWLCSQIESIPFEFPTADLNAKQRKIDGWDGGAVPEPGVVAHQDFDGHADGRWPLEELMNRLNV